MDSLEGTAIRLVQITTSGPPLTTVFFALPHSDGGPCFGKGPGYGGLVVWRNMGAVGLGKEKPDVGERRIVWDVCMSDTIVDFTPRPNSLEQTTGKA